MPAVLAQRVEERVARGLIEKIDIGLVEHDQRLARLPQQPLEPRPVEIGADGIGWRVQNKDARAFRQPFCERLHREGPVRLEAYLLDPGFGVLGADRVEAESGRAHQYGLAGAQDQAKEDADQVLRPAGECEAGRIEFQIRGNQRPELALLPVGVAEDLGTGGSERLGDARRGAERVLIAVELHHPRQPELLADRLKREAGIVIGAGMKARADQILDSGQGQAPTAARCLGNSTRTLTLIGAPQAWFTRTSPARPISMKASA